MMLLRRTIQQPDFGRSPALLVIAEEVIRHQPNLCKALWHHSLSLAKQDKPENARRSLISLRLQVAERPYAIRTLGSLLAKITTQIE